MPETTRLQLPSSGWAEFRVRVDYGARRQLRKYASSVGATAIIGGKQNEVTGVKIAAEELVSATEAADYFPVVYMLVDWSFGRLPTMTDLTPLDNLSWDDGEFIFEAAHKAFNQGTTLDFSPDAHEDPASPTDPSDESQPPSEGHPSMNGTGSQKSLSSTAS